jgi:hypothetical protein
MGGEAYREEEAEVIDDATNGEEKHCLFWGLLLLFLFFFLTNEEGVPKDTGSGKNGREGDFAVEVAGGGAAAGVGAAGEDMLKHEKGM